MEATTMNKETRAFEFEIRAEETENEARKGRITGTPIVFNQATDLGWCEERIAPDALNGTDLKDVRFLIGHDTSMVPLARSRNNNENSTMQMTVTERGMEIRVDLDVEGNPRAAELYSAVKRGDISGMSFMFTVDKDSWEDIDTDYPKRTVEHISRVLEVSAVAFPAYPQTDIQAASEDAALDSARASLESARKAAEEERARIAEDERRTAALERLNNLIKEVKHDEV
jgi:HK97 family phage prohead protease